MPALASLPLPEASPPPPTISLRRLIGEITSRAGIAVLLAGEPSPKGERGAAAAGKLFALLGSLQELVGEQVDFNALARAAGKEVMTEYYGDRVDEDTITKTIEYPLQVLARAAKAGLN